MPPVVPFSKHMPPCSVPKGKAVIRPAGDVLDTSTPAPLTTGQQIAMGAMALFVVGGMMYLLTSENEPVRRNPSSYKYRDIIYLRDSNSEKGLEILKRDGVDAALDYLLRFDKGIGKTRKSLMAPGHRISVGNYVLFHDEYAPHIGLVEVIAQ